MFYIFISCVIGIGILNLILAKINKGVAEKFRIENNLEKRKFVIFKKIANTTMKYILCFTPIMQFFTTIIIFILIVLYSSKDDEVKEKLIKAWK